MRLHFLQHVPFEGPGCIRDWAEAAGWEISGSHLYRDQRLPAVGDLDWLVIMGGPMNVYEDVQYPWLSKEKHLIDQAIAGRKVVLGVCLGAQLIADVLGARISANPHREIGWYPVYRSSASVALPQVSAIEDTVDALHWHGDTFDLPDGAVHLARSEACDNQAFVYGERTLALQFHLEMTPEGLQTLVKHCAGEIEPGPYMQSPENMLSDPKRFRRANRMMRRLLDGLAQLEPVDPHG